MALLIEVVYPSGEHVIATGYLHRTLVVQIVPRGPDAAYLDELEVDFTGDEPYRVVRVLGGPRRRTVRVRVDLLSASLRDAARPGEAGACDGDHEAWLDAREADGWYGRVADDGSGELWVVAERDGLDARALESAGARLVG